MRGDATPARHAAIRNATDVKGFDMEWRDLTYQQKKECYMSYVCEIKDEFGDAAKHMTFDEWCKDSEKLEEPIGVII